MMEKENSFIFLYDSCGILAGKVEKYITPICAKIVVINEGVNYIDFSENFNQKKKEGSITFSKGDVTHIIFDKCSDIQKLGFYKTYEELVEDNIEAFL